MKHTFKYIVTLLALLGVALAAGAQTYNEQGGVSTAKTVTGPNEDGSYTLTLETFAMGTSTLITTSTPVDVVLVLDVSSSMKDSYNGTTRIAALKEAVTTFVEEIARNDHEDDDGNERAKLLGNRIQIITFSGNNNTQVLFSSGFQPAYDNLSTIKNQIINISTSTGTRTDLGMSTASTWASTSKSATYWTENNLKEDNDHNIVVVMFTDGCPSTSGSTNFNCEYAKDAVNSAYTIKQSYGATVYSIGLITWSAIGGETSTRSIAVKNMMNYISSNYPDGQATGQGIYSQEDSETTSNRYFNCTGTNTSSIYYQDANEVNLKTIFENIAHASGGSSETIGASTQVRDVVSSSFVLPDEASADDITIYTMDITSDGLGWGNQQTPSGVTPVVSKNAEGNNTVTVQGFDFSADDNWVGLRYDSNNDPYYAGKKLVIQFNIVSNSAATGGVGTPTNTSDSGVYVWNEDKEEYVCINYYEVPHTELPINITITKRGLRSGESATFEIQRADPRTDDEGHILYNAIGKPLPALNKDGEEAFETWTKVIVTNKETVDGAEVTKILVALDPNYVYKVLEDTWGWAYDVAGTGETMTTSTVQVNPFQFTNTEKTGVVKHAEAITINHFATSASGTDAKTETYKSSKVESF